MSAESGGGVSAEGGGGVSAEGGGGASFGAGLDARLKLAIDAAGVSRANVDGPVDGHGLLRSGGAVVGGSTGGVVWSGCSSGPVVSSDCISGGVVSSGVALSGGDFRGSMGGVLDLHARAAGAAPAADRNSAAGTTRSEALTPVTIGATALAAFAPAVVLLNGTDLADRVGVHAFAAAVVLPGTVSDASVLASAAGPASLVQFSSSSGLYTVVFFIAGANCVQFISTVGTGLDRSGANLSVGARGRPVIRQIVEEEGEAPAGVNTADAAGGGLDGVSDGRCALAAAGTRCGGCAKDRGAAVCIYAAGAETGVAAGVDAAPRFGSAASTAASGADASPRLGSKSGVVAGADAAPGLESAAGTVAGTDDAPRLGPECVVVLSTVVVEVLCCPAVVATTALGRRAVAAGAELRNRIPADATLVDANAVAALPPDVFATSLMTASAASSACRIASRLKAAAAAVAADCATIDAFSER